MLDLSWVSMDVDNWHCWWDYLHASGGIVQSFLKPWSSRAMKANLGFLKEHVLSGLLVTQAKESCEKAIHLCFSKCKQWVCVLVKICTVRLGDKVQYSVCLYVDAYPQGQNMWWLCGSNITIFFVTYDISGSNVANIWWVSLFHLLM